MNLTIADLLKATFGLPMVVVSSFYQKWVFGQIGEIINLIKIRFVLNKNSIDYFYLKNFIKKKAVTIMD